MSNDDLMLSRLMDISEKLGKVTSSLDELKANGPAHCARGDRQDADIAALRLDMKKRVGSGNGNGWRNILGVSWPVALRYVVASLVVIGALVRGELRAESKARDVARMEVRTVATQAVASDAVLHAVTNMAARLEGIEDYLAGE